MENNKKIMGASFLINFQEKLNILIDAYSEFLLLEIEVKTKNIDLETAKDFSNQIRKIIMQVYISYYTLNKIINKKDNENIEKLIDIFKKNVIINPIEVESFIKEVSLFCYSESIQELINTSKNILYNLYNVKGGDNNDNI